MSRFLKGFKYPVLFITLLLIILVIYRKSIPFELFVEPEITPATAPVTTQPFPTALNVTSVPDAFISDTYPPSAIVATPANKPESTPVSSPLAPSTSENDIANSVISTQSNPSSIASPLSTSYEIFALLDYENHHLTVSQTITYVNKTSVPLSELVLVVEPNRKENVFQLKALRWANGQVVDSFDLNEARLRVTLPSLLLPDTSVSLLLTYELNIPEQPGPFGYTLRQTNLGDWYPFIPPYHARTGWLIHEPTIVGEHLVYDVADFNVNVRFLGREDDLVIAASAPVKLNGDQYEYYINTARSFALSVSPEYQVVTETVRSTIVASYFFPEDQIAGNIALQTTVDAVEVFSEVFGRYPHPGLTVVEAEFQDGMEYDGFYFLDQVHYDTYGSSPQSYLTAIAAHETAHQWWYGIVGNDQALEPWLDETMATYSELLFYEEKAPEFVDWWWQVRVLRFNTNISSLGSSIYDHDDYRSYVNTVYLQGALFMDEVRNAIGDEAFFEFLHDLVKIGGHNLITAADFWQVLAENSQKDIESIKNSYFLTH